MVLGVMKQNRHFFMMLLGEVWRHPELKERIGAEIYSEGIGFLAEQLRTLMRQGKLRSMDPTIAAKAWIGMMQSYFIFNYLVGPGHVDPTEEENDLEGLAEIFVRGVGDREGI
ncbi:MAG: TetR/AcrR family transcriptional regulator C-terminal domain-containing protein, partial [Methanomassiliicoccales archaeon]|nr:TetR/AcrR family transcriptional regulator C-terminal domain-containing protein [Methanomassiliicoccales archaeon]